MKIVIVSTGDELLRGAIPDTNAAWMAASLHERGFSVDRMVTVGDDEAAIGEVLAAALNEFDLTIVGGGLGPTDDDLTARAAARALGCGIVRNPEAAGQVERAFERLGRSMPEVNLKQADLPEACSVLENRLGTAPGFQVATEKGRAIFLPGVPFELMSMFEQYVLSELPGAGPPLARAVFKCFGTGESNIQTMLRPVADAFPAVRWSFRASFPEIGVTLTAADQSLLDQAASEASSALGRTAFAREDIDLPTALGRTLGQRGYTAATAESCTGGLIGHSITEVPGASDYFRGGIVAYDNSIKQGALGVDEAVLADDGAVSEPVVRAMAEGARQLFDADVGLAVSGIAGPTGGTEQKPVGTVHLAVAYPDGLHHLHRVFKGFNRSRVKRVSAWTAMWMALCALSEKS